MKMPDRNINVLFVCKYNIFRSKVAQAYFEKINKNKNIIIKSAGIFPGGKQDPNLIKLCKEFGLELKGKPQGVNIKLLKWANIIIIVADDIPKKLFKHQREYPKDTVCWKIKDVFKIDKDIPGKRRKSIRKIMKKVDKLNGRLDKKLSKEIVK
jgi:protein-tyrosine-phosphatase